VRRWLATGLTVGLGVVMPLTIPGTANAGEEDETLVEFHFDPVPNLQIAIWIEDAEGNFIKDVFVTQAVGKLGIGNRPGIWNFLSSWRAPYGPRLSALPIWGHARGKTYPAITFHDSNPGTQTSLGFHESTSSFEGYHCRPLRPDENDAVMDAMTCPSPQVFQSDKGKFTAQTRVYPPRNDLIEFDADDDHPDMMMYEELNDLDAVTGATFSGNGPALRTVKLHKDEVGAASTLVAWIEISLEHDENSDYEYDRDNDHFVDPKLPDYGIEWLGQPSVVYRVEFDPTERGFTGTDDYAGYGDWDGASGDIHDPDSTISTANGSGAARLRQVDDFGDLFRWGIFNHGYGEDGGGDGTGDDGGGSEGDDGGGSCTIMDLPQVEDLEFEPLDFDTVAVDFQLPDTLPANTELSRIRVFYKPSQETLDAETLLDGTEHGFSTCTQGDNCDIIAGPGDAVHLEVTQLFGDFTYQFAVAYEDRCTNESAPNLGSATTPIQEFQQIDTFCFVATAAFGANWAAEVGALRAFRDVVLKPTVLGRQGVLYYYAYGPALARIIGYSALLRAVTRSVLQPVASASKPLIRLAD
jgi:hypothetical protein